MIRLLESESNINCRALRYVFSSTVITRPFPLTVTLHIHTPHLRFVKHTMYTFPQRGIRETYLFTSQHYTQILQKTYISGNYIFAR